MSTTSTEPQVLFTTIHGSMLYGLAHADSDVDMFTVTDSPRRKARQGFDDQGVDATRMGLAAFLEKARSGSHQSVEALFSRKKVWTPEGERYRPMLEGLRITGEDVFVKYLRTITKFAFSEGDKGFKRRRHAARLALSLRGLREEGRFEPELSLSDALHCTRLAELEGQELLGKLERLATPRSWT